LRSSTVRSGRCGAGRIWSSISWRHPPFLRITPVSPAVRSRSRIAV
jgi:hypothetical protein